MKNDSFYVIICRVGLQGKRKKKKNDPPVLGRYMNKQKLNSNNIAYHIKMLKLLK